MKPTAISLFSGIGGIDLAFSRAGFDIVAQVEIDPFCRKILAKHAPQYWPNAVQYEDVKNVGQHNLPTADVIFGGFPCQDISVAGKQAGIKEGTRSGLWFEFARIIGELRPRFVFLENVPAITRNGGSFVAGNLAALGYDAFWCVVPAFAVDAPHRRERWYCVAYTAHAGLDWRVGVERDATAGSEHRSAYRGNREDGGIEAVPNAISAGLEGSRYGTIRTSAKITVPAHYDTGTISVSGLSESHLGRAIDGVPGRLDAIRRISRFPAPPGRSQAEWEAPRTAPKMPDHANRLKALGNAVVPQVVQLFADIIREQLHS